MIDTTKLKPNLIWIVKRFIKIYGPILVALWFLVKLLCLYSLKLSSFDINEVANIYKSLGLDEVNNSSLSKHYILCSHVGLGLVQFTKETLFSNSQITTNINTSSFLSHPNIPSFLVKPAKISNLMPDIHRIRWTGVIWQESWRNYPKFVLYSAHFDNREQKLHQGCNNTYVRVLGLYDGDHEPSKYSCLLWFDESEQPILTVIHQYDIIDWQGFSSNSLVPYMITCVVPQMEQQLKAPVAVSVVNNSCLSPSNVLQITGLPPGPSNSSNSTSKSSFNSNDLSVGICGPALYYYSEDFSHRLIEWFEIMHSIGASKIIFYKTVNHPNVEKVLKYYEEIGRLKIVSFHYPPPYADDPSLRRPWTFKERKSLFALENIYFTDCILRFKDEFQYLAHFDPDEVPILKKHKTLGELLSYLKKYGSHSNIPASYFLPWKTFYPNTPGGKSAMNISKRFYILSHNRRPKSFIKKIDFNGKSIYDTSRVLAAYSHKPLLYVDKKKYWKKEYVVDPSIAYTAHFRSSECGSSCNNIMFTEENFLLQFKDKIINEVNFVLKKLNISVKD